MKILMVHPERDEKYGAVHSMLEMLTYLNKNYNIEPILLISKEGYASNYCQKMNWKYYITKHANFMIGASSKRKEILRTILLPLLYIRYKIKSMIALRLVDKYIDFNEIDLIHTNTSVCDLGALLSRKYHKPHFWHLREVGNLGYNRISLRKDYINFMNLNTTNFIAISNVVKDKWHEMGIDDNKISVIYNGVEDYNIIKNNHDNIKMVMTGSLSEQKGQHILIDALGLIDKDKLKNVTLDIIGDGEKDYKKFLIKKIEQYNLSNNIKLLGYQSNIKELLKDYDIGFICSKNEGFGRVAVEYMLSKTCVISSNKGALKEIVIDKKTGLLFDYPNTLDLAHKITYIIENKGSRNTLIDNAYYYAKNHFTDSINAKNIYMNYMKYIGDKNE